MALGVMRFGAFLAEAYLIVNHFQVLVQFDIDAMSKPSSSSTASTPSKNKKAIAGSEKKKSTKKPSRKVATDDSIYKWEDILDFRGQPGHREYLVKWAGYAEPTWEPSQNFDEDSAALPKVEAMLMSRVKSPRRKLM